MTEHEGSRGRYAMGCHCDACREKNRVYMEAWRRKRGVRPRVVHRLAVRGVPVRAEPDHHERARAAAAMAMAYT